MANERVPVNDWNAALEAVSAPQSGICGDGYAEGFAAGYAKGFSEGLEEGRFERYADLRHDTEGELRG